MTQFAAGSLFNISYIKEVTPGTTPGTPAMKVFRTTGTDLDLGKETFTSNELRSDQEIVDFRHGNRQTQGNLNFELSYGAFDDWLLAVLGQSSWTAAATKTATTIAFVNSNPDTITDSGNGFVTAGFEVGDQITVTGAAQAGNNSTFTIATVAAGTLTLTGGASLTAESAGNSITITSARQYAKTGTTPQYFTVEGRHTDVSVYRVFTGTRTNGLTLSIQPNAPVTGAFAVMGFDVTNNTSSLDAAPDDVANNSVFTIDSGTIKVGGSAVAYVTGIDLSFTRNLSPAFVAGAVAVQQHFAGRASLTGTVNMFLQDKTWLDKFANETVFDLEVRVTDGTNYYDLILPRLKPGNASAPVQGEGGIVVAVPFQGLRDATVGASFKIERSNFA